MEKSREKREGRRQKGDEIREKTEGRREKKRIIVSCRLYT